MKISGQLSCMVIAFAQRKRWRPLIAEMTEWQTSSWSQQRLAVSALICHTRGHVHQVIYYTFPNPKRAAKCSACAWMGMWPALHAEHLGSSKCTSKQKSHLVVNAFVKMNLHWKRRFQWTWRPLQFCEATVDAARFQLLDSGYEHDHIPGAVQKSIAYTHAWLKQMLPVHVCQQALSASKVSITDSSSLGFGRMAPLVAKANSADRNAWEHALTRVCHDECEQLVRETLENFHDIAMKDPEKGISFTRSCASKVVQKVEAETLGCCSRVCGWNNVTCMSWPFLSPNQKI